MPDCRGMGFGGKQAKQPVSSSATLTRCLCAYPEGWVRETSPTSSFVPEEVTENATSHRFCPQKVKSLPPCALDDLQLVLSARVSCMPSSRSRPSLSGLYPSLACQLLKLQSLSPVAKTHENQPLSFSQPIALEKCSCCVYPCAFHSHLHQPPELASFCSTGDPFLS